MNTGGIIYTLVLKAIQGCENDLGDIFEMLGLQYYGLNCSINYLCTVVETVLYH